MLYVWGDVAKGRLHVTRGRFDLQGLTFIPTWISKHMPSKVWNEITYAFQNFNCCTFDIWEWVGNSIPRFWTDVFTTGIK